MKIVKRLLTIFIVLFVFTPSSFSQDQIVYLDLDYVVVNTKAGKSILRKLENSKNIALSKFEKKGKELQKIEEEINKQKNIISEVELRKKLIEFRKEVSTYQKNRQKVINDFNQKKKSEFDNFFKKITPIIENYVNENKIDFVLDKKNIFVASKKKNITLEIIKIIDSKIK